SAPARGAGAARPPAGRPAAARPAQGGAKPPGPGTASPGTASPGTASPGTAGPGTASPGTTGPRRAAAAPVERRSAAAPRGAQRLYVKIAADREHPAALERLKALLADHPGPLSTVLFYESEGRTIALSERYKIKPSPELVGGIEGLLGKGSAVVK
ncbi:DNA polymerase III subunit alpha, partial [Paenibacillus sp. D51F]